MDMRSYMKNSEKLTLVQPMTIEELHGLMTQYAYAMPGRFELKKGLMGASIKFDEYLETEPVIKVKGSVVTVSKSTVSSGVSINGMDLGAPKRMAQQAQAFQEGGLGKAITGGQEYFLKVIETMKWLLQNRMAAG
ncbi:MAG: hypothetical protein FWD55_07995 [Propionibacteriaceae bacterium]|nr:hypothetical protein [Propionibacteriaceae bacterium]